MRAVVQRVTEADVSVDGKITGRIEKGLVVLIGVESGDTDRDLDYIVKKVANLRVFDDESGVMNLSAVDSGGSILAVSQFTLLGDVRKGNRPSYFAAAEPQMANEMYREACRRWREEFHLSVQEGVFRAEMLVKIYNDGPVTILLDSRRNF